MRESWVKKHWMAVVLPIVLVGVLALGVLLGRKTAVPGDPTGIADPDAALDGTLNWNEGERIGYAANVVTDDPETLQTMVDRLYEESEDVGISLEYKNLLISDDGVNFACYIGNSKDNNFDMFFTIYADQQLTEELYVSELLRPGSRFEKIAFKEKLEPGTYTGYMVQTRVYDEEVNDQMIQVIHGNIAVTVDIFVNP